MAASTASAPVLPVYWDEFTWDEFVWDGRNLAPSQLSISGSRLAVVHRVQQLMADHGHDGLRRLYVDEDGVSEMGAVEEGLASESDEDDRLPEKSRGGSRRSTEVGAVGRSPNSMEHDTRGSRLGSSIEPLGKNVGVSLIGRRGFIAVQRVLRLGLGLGLIGSGGGSSPGLWGCAQYTSLAGSSHIGLSAVVGLRGVLRSFTLASVRPLIHQRLTPLVDAGAATHHAQLLAERHHLSQRVSLLDAEKSRDESHELRQHVRARHLDLAQAVLEPGVRPGFEDKNPKDRAWLKALMAEPAY